MTEVSSADVQRNFSAYREQAAHEPVMVLHDNKPDVVILSAAEFARLKLRDKKVMRTEDLPEWLIEKIAAGKMAPEFAHLDEPAD